MRKWICLVAALLLATSAVASEDDADNLGWGDAAGNAEPNPVQIKLQRMLQREANALKKSGRCSSDEYLAILCEQTKNIIILCEREWKLDFSTQQECEEWFRISAARMNLYRKLPATDRRRKIAAQCIDESTLGGIVKWGMAETCLIFEIPADQRLR